MADSARSLSSPGHRAREACIPSSHRRIRRLPVSEMSRDQRELVDGTLAALLSPFRRRDRDEAMGLLEAAGGVDNLTMAFYQNEDLGNDGVWDVGSSRARP